MSERDQSTTTEPAPGAGIPIDGAANLRDLGGWATADGGTVAHGAVFRSTELSGLSDAGLAVLAELGVVTVFDLRSSAERDANPDRLPDGVSEVHLDVLADLPGNPTAAVAQLPELLSNPDQIDPFLADGAVIDQMAAAYRDIVGSSSARHAYRTMFTTLADAPRRPALFHCTTGKDRTGWGAAALLSLLGVSEDDVYADYLATNTEILAFTQPMYDTFAAHGGDPDLLRPFLGVERSYLATAFDEMQTRFGTIEGYFTDGLGLDADVIDALRRSLVVTAA